MPDEVKRVNYRTTTARDGRPRPQGYNDRQRNPVARCSKRESAVESAPEWSNMPSTSSDNHQTANDERLSSLLHQVIFNDFIMYEIFGYIVNIQDRLNLEDSCRLFRKISKKAPWKFAKWRDELHLTYFALDTEITIETGDLKFKRPSMTMVDRRECAGPRNCQRPELLSTLTGLASRFGSKIKTLWVGGTDENALMYGIGEHQLIVTEDLLKVLVTSFPEVENVRFRNCGFDKDAVNFLHTCQGPVFPKLKHLFLRSIWCDADALPYKLMRLIQPGLQSLSLSYIKIEQNIGEALMAALEEKSIRLKEVDVTIANYFRVQPISVQHYLRCLSRSSNRIAVRLTGDRFDDRSPALMAGFQAAVELENLAQVEMGHYPHGRHENFDYDDAIKALRSCNLLQELALNGWQDFDIINSLISSLTGAFLLERFTLRNVPETRNPVYIGQLDKLLSVLKVSELELANIKDMNSNHLRTLCKNLPGLKILRLSRVNKVSSHAVEQCIRKWKHLEVLDIETALAADGIDTLCSTRYMPKLVRACFWMQADLQQRSSMVKLLKNFERVDCWTNGTPDRYCRVSIRTRRSVPLECISETDVTYCHADHNPIVHEPLPPRERWDSRPLPHNSPAKNKSAHSHGHRGSIRKVL